MEKTYNSHRKGFRFSAFGLVLCFLASLLTGCQEKPLDITDLLSTVPSSTGGVAGINVKALLQKSGCKVEGSSITPGSELQQLIQANGESQSPLFSVLLNGESGIDPMGAVAFFDANRAYVTFLIADINKFKAFVEQMNEEKFSSQEGIEVCGNVALKGPQAWICLTSNNIQDPRAIDAYTSLSPSQSFIQNPYAEEIALMKEDITGWVTLRTLLGQTVSFNEIAGINLVASVLFEDPQSISFKASFDNGKFVLSANMLNGKGKPSKYLLPADKVDPATIERLGESADFLVAFTITPKLVEGIARLGKAVMPGYYDTIKEGLEHLDGTVGVAFSNPDSIEQNISGVVTTDGQTPLTLLQLISEIAPYRKDGKLVFFSKGQISGNLDIKEAAQLLKGTAIGVVGNIQTIKNDPFPSLKTLSVTFTPESGSLKCIFTVTGNNPKENILLSIIKDNPKGLF